MSNSCLKRIVYNFLNYATVKVPEKGDEYVINPTINLFHLKPEILLDTKK